MHALEPRLLGARDDGIEVGGEDLVGEMAMTVDHFQWRGPPAAN